MYRYYCTHGCVCQLVIKENGGGLTTGGGGGGSGKGKRCTVRNSQTQVGGRGGDREEKLWPRLERPQVRGPEWNGWRGHSGGRTRPGQQKQSRRDGGRRGQSRTGTRKERERKRADQQQECKRVEKQEADERQRKKAEEQTWRQQAEKHRIGRDIDEKKAENENEYGCEEGAGEG